MSFKVLLAPTAELAKNVLATEDVLLTVEAEYGAYVEAAVSALVAKLG